MKRKVLKILLFNGFLVFAFAELNIFSFENISELTENFNVFIALNLEKNVTLENLICLYSNESIKFGLVLEKYHSWDAVGLYQSNFALFPRREKDRKCLIKPSFQFKPKPIALIPEPSSFADIVEFINEQCFYFVDVNGELNKAGKLRENIIRKLYHVETNKQTCQRVKATISQETFLQDFLLSGKPFIIEDAITKWPAFSKWTNKYLRDSCGHHTVHVKLTPDGIFEGCDKANKFSNYNTFKIPKEVKQKLEFPDLVVVRPAVADIPFYKFLDVIEDETFQNISAYLEYSSIRENFKHLEEDVEELDIVKNILKLKHLNIWLSNGNTLGKLHFDPFDNFLCQISGEKHLVLYEPHNNKNLYEAHIQEGILSYNWETGKFKNSKLLDSTSMVMSPVDILNPDLSRFPRFSNANRLECHLSEGDALFMPSFWWHEVQSKPSSVENRNLAVNFWYEPFYQKEFPCQECKLDVNPFYSKLLKKFAKKYVI